MAKITVEFNDQTQDVLDKLASARGTTKVDVLRRALAVYKVLSEETDPAKSSKLKVSLTDATGKAVKDIIFT